MLTHKPGTKYPRYYIDPEYRRQVLDKQKERYLTDEEFRNKAKERSKGNWQRTGKAYYDSHRAEINRRRAELYYLKHKKND